MRALPLHYFHLNEPDPEDELAARYRQEGHVPLTCLLGGKLLEALLKLKKDPCQSCQGPRDRCQGRPKASDRELGYAAERERLRALMLGSDQSVLDVLNQSAPPGRNPLRGNNR